MNAASSGVPAASGQLAGHQSRAGGLQNVARVVLAASALAAALHLGQSYMPTACATTLQWLSAWLGPWLGTPALIAALALALYPRAPVASPVGATATDSVQTEVSERDVCSFPILDSLAEACEHAAGTSGAAAPPGGSLLRRLARKLSSARRRLASGRDAAAAALHVDSPFFRRNRAPSFRSLRGSSESLSARWGQDYRSCGGRRQSQAPALSRLGSGSVSEATTQDVMSHAAMSQTARSSKGEWASSDAFVYTGHLAVDCLPFDTTEPVNEEVKQFVTELHLLQFGMLIGESSAELAVGMQGAAQPVGLGSDSLYGPVDCHDQFQRGWERIIEEHKEGLHYWVQRRHLRKGLFMYKSRTVYENARPDQMVAFTFTDCETRRMLWDDCAAALEPIAPPSRRDMTPDEVRTAARSQSSFMYARTRFPPPMAQREYVYARRVWYKTDDGGCYCINKTCAHPAPPDAGCRTTRVHDFSSGFVVRAVPGIYSSAPAVEVSTVYFEDSCAHAGIINMAIRKAMWPMTQKSERGLRRFIATLEASQPPRRTPPFTPAPSTMPSPASMAGSPCPQAAADGEAPMSGDAAAPGPCDRSEEPAALGAEGSRPEIVSDSSPDSSADMFGPSSSALRNASMFSGYYPALSRRLHVTPILYACYMAAWRYAALALRALLASHRLGWGLFCRWHGTLLRWAMRGVAACRAQLLARQQRRESSAKLAACSDRLKSYPLVLGGASEGLAGGSRFAGPRPLPYSLSMRRQGLGRRLTQLAAVAAKAAGLPLVHCLLNGKLGSRAPPSTQVQPQRSPVGSTEALPSAGDVSGPNGALGMGQPPRGGRYVRPVVVDGVVVGHCPPKPARQPPKARSLLQVMLGLRAPEDARQEAHPHLHRRPLSRRIM